MSSGSASPSNIPSAIKSAHEGASERARVLLVDDEPRVVEALAPLLRRSFDVTAVTSSVEALALVRDGRFSAVVSDLRMPVMDGVTLLEGVKRVSPGTARILLTGQGDMASAIAAINGAAVHLYLVKPCPPGSVCEAIRAAIATNNGLDGETLTDLGRKAALGAIAGGIGHEMANALVALDGSIAAVREDIANGRAVQEEDLALLDLVKERFTDHAGQLKDLSRPQPLQIADVDLAKIVADTIAMMQRSGTLRSAHVTTSSLAEPMIARADARAVEGVLVNLLKNAAEALETKAAAEPNDGSISIPSHIRVALSTDESHVAIAVTDTGCGIAPDRVARLFEPHRSTKGERGNGLGLGIARAVLQRQGGTISVSSTLGVGTRFEIRLPRARKV